MKAKVINLIIAGVGGQGVNTLSEVIATLCAKSNFHYQGAIFKGGAQRLGSIHSEIKIFSESISDSEYFSNQIPKGSLDVIIGLEPYETIRYQQYFHTRTKIFVNSEKTALYVERYKKIELKDPIEELKKLSSYVINKNFSELSLQLYGNMKMTNYLILKESIYEGALPFSISEVNQEFEERFQNTIL
jgi:indolepyruvate ferredoxin oxidoreductase